MKKVLVLLGLVLLSTSCEPEPPCECTKQTYSYKYEIPSGNQTKINVEFENVGCADEVSETEIDNTTGDVQLVRYYKITCN